MIGDHDNFIISDDFLVSDIIEYDMKEAGWSMIQNENIVPPDIMESLKKLDKHDRHIEIGKLKYKIKGFQRSLSECFRKYRLLFIASNELTEKDIVSIKKDAIFVKKFCYNTEFGNNVKFVEKHCYSIFMKLGKLEFYWGNDNVLDVKGINDVHLEKHRDYMLKFIWTLMSKMAFDDRISAIKYIVRFMNDYKFRRLNAGYYRMFNSTPMYPLMINGEVQIVEEIGNDYIDQCDIAYNYTDVLVPLLKLVNS